ncbi:MAG: prolyl oligopeptidase family serine peptidase [Sedimentisphaerales bacterium]|nr:prolyl oligopeptidase family serine peptidase [Sedimentisphaerales bacterium]
MKALSLVLLLGWATWLAQETPNATEQAKVKPGQQAQTMNRPVIMKSQYWLYLPAEYGRTEKKWPLILFLHGAGERGDNLELVTKHGPPKLARQGKAFPFIIVSPQCPTNYWWPTELEVLNALLDEIIEKYPVDTSRIYLTGLSMGGFGSWSLACRNPERFAAVAPICGGGQPYLAGQLKDVPVWAFHGGKDPVVPPKLSEEMVQAVKNAGGDARLTVYPEAGHDSWTEAYNDPKLYEWFLSHQKKKDK